MVVNATLQSQDGPFALSLRVQSVLSKPFRHVTMESTPTHCMALSREQRARSRRPPTCVFK